MRKYVTYIGDGDKLRIYHTPDGIFAGWGIFRFPPEKTKDTVSIRIAGVDAPECAHFGKPSQPFSKEALNWLKQYTIYRNVKETLWRRDQYNRIVGSVRIWKWSGNKDVGLEMVKAGYATVYTASGAEYGGLEAKLKRAERLAKILHRGMWAQSKNKYESPTDYKKRMAAIKSK